MKFTHILAPTDLSDAATAALMHARLFADCFGAKLTVMYSDPIVYPIDVMPESQAIYVASTPEHAARLRREVETYAAEWMDGRPYDVVAEVGQPVQMILHAAETAGADLIVMGTHALRGWRRAVLGSVTEGVLHGSRIPVLTVTRPPSHGLARPPLAVTRVLCPVNFTAVSRDALHHAADVAEAFKAELVVVHVIEPGSHVVPEEEPMREMLRGITPVPLYRELTLRGGAAERVLDCVEDIGADLLVIGAQHKLFRDATVIGTTTERLVRFATCPVLSVARELVPKELVSTESMEYASITK